MSFYRMTQLCDTLFLLLNRFSNQYSPIKMKTRITNDTTDAFTLLFDSSSIVVLFILLGVFIMIGAFYGAKLWYDIKEIQKYLNKQESDPEQDVRK